MRLRAVNEALTDILADLAPLNLERIPLARATGRMLAEDVRADADYPAAALSSMDGFAVRAEDIAAASEDEPVQLPVVMHIPAGGMAERALASGEAARIMTGAPLPPGADAIAPVETTDADWSAPGNDGEAVQFRQHFAAGAFVRPRGEDLRAGEVALAAGRKLHGAEIGTLASLGVARPLVYRQPRVAILSSGDELLAIDQPLLPGHIRESNSYALASLVEEYGGIPIRFPPARDDLDEIRNLLWSVALRAPDLILSSAGVSVGAADFMLAAIEEIGELHFWRVNMRPGKPLVYGRLQGIPYFGLPGNPVSALVTFDVFVRAALMKMGGYAEGEWQAPLVKVRAGEDFHTDGRRTYLRARLEFRDGQWRAHSTGTQSSGAMMSMVRADGLLILQEGVKTVSAGSELPFRPFHPLREPESEAS